MKCEKWLNSRGFARNKHLYNYWFAKDYIKQSGSAILVEGQGDVLKLEMAGIHNSLGIFGVELTQSQNILIDKLAPRRVYIATDNDKAGSAAAQKLLHQLKSRFSVVVMTPSQKDFGDMSTREIHEYFTLNYEE
jgi:DNA primase